MKYALVAAAALMASTSANAAVLYTSGPINGTVSGRTINSGFMISTSFELLSAQTVTGFTFGGWTFPGDQITSIGYGLSTTRDYATPATATLTAGATIPGAGFNYYDVREYAGSIAPTMLAAGTYYLTLANANAGGNPAYWDVNGGATSSQQNGADIAGVAFTIQGNPVGGAVPEPATWAMMIAGVGLVGGAMRRRSARITVSFA